MPELLKSKIALWIGVGALVVGGGAVFLVARGNTKAVGAGSFEVSPSQITFDARTEKPNADGTLAQMLSLHNTTSTAASFALSSDADWLILGAGASGTVAPEATMKVTLLADPTAATSEQHASLEVSNGGFSTTIAVTLLPGGSNIVGGSGLKAVPAALLLGEASSQGQVELLNSTSRPIEWGGATSDSWITVAPTHGSLASGARTKVAITVQRAGLSEGAHPATVTLSYAGGQTTISLRIDVGTQPLLVLPVKELNFGRARQGRKTLAFLIQNGGYAPLTYTVSNDRFYVYLPLGATGTVPPGQSATVEVTFDHDRSEYGIRDYPLRVTSNGGSGEVRVYGITDTVGPLATNQTMSAIFTGSDGKEHRWARADLKDEFGAVAGGRVQWRVCTGNPPAVPSCTQWDLSQMHNYQGPTWEADVGPLPSCTPAVGEYVGWRLQADDDLNNHQFNPGSSTFYVFTHCPSPGKS